MLFIFSETLQSRASWQFFITQFRIPLIIFPKLLGTVVKTVADDLHDNEAVAAENRTRMKFLEGINFQFFYHPNAWYSYL